MFFSVWFFYPTERGQEFKYFSWYFSTSDSAERNARKYAQENIPNCTKITIGWSVGGSCKTRTLRKNENGEFRRGRK